MLFAPLGHYSEICFAALNLYAYVFRVIAFPVTSYFICPDLASVLVSWYIFLSLYLEDKSIRVSEIIESPYLWRGKLVPFFPTAVSFNPCEPLRTGRCHQIESTCTHVLALIESGHFWTLLHFHIIQVSDQACCPVFSLSPC